MTTKKGEGYTNKGAVKLHVSLYRMNYLNVQSVFSESNLESQNYHSYKK